MDVATLRIKGPGFDELPDWDSERTLVVVFFPPRWSGALDQLATQFPRSQVVGCSTAGEILDGVVSDDSAVAAVVRFDACGLASSTTTLGPGRRSFEAGSRLAADLAARARRGEPLRAILALSDGLGVNGSELARGLSETLPPGVVVTGGLAGDGDRFERTSVLHGSVARSGAVTAVGFYGEAVDVRTGSQGGWDVFGVERAVTRASGNVVYELDGRPILDLYREYLGERAAGLPATALLFPLALRCSRETTHSLVRTVLGIDEAERSMRFAGDVPEGSLVQLMRANFDRLVQGASDAAAMTALRDDPRQCLVLAISCVGRRLVLGQRVEEETEATLENFGPRARQIGFYSYGELSPAGGGTCELHNQTMTLTAILER